MKILPIINTSSNNYHYSKQASQNLYSGNNICYDSVSFGASKAVQSKKAFRKLLKYNIPDMYTGRPMLSPDFVEDLHSKNVFNRSIKDIVKIILPHKDCLQPVESKVFDIIQKTAKNNPALSLSDVMRMNYAKANQKLLKLQEPILKKLEELAKGLPENKHQEFQELMRTTRLMLNNKTIIQPFNKTDFKYKLKRFEDNIKLSGNDEEISTIKKLIKMAGQFPYIKNKNKFYSNKIAQSQEMISKQSQNIRCMISFFERSPLSKNEDLKKLLENAKTQIFGLPSLVPFGRKNFIRSINEIIKDIPDRELATKMHAAAIKLPTSQQAVPAFIVKASRSSSEKIGTDLLFHAIGSIEHIQPKSKGGIDAYENYGLSATIVNSNRGTIDMQTYLLAHPEAYTGCQKYVDRLIELQNRKVLKKIGIPKSYISNFVKIMRRLSPFEKPMIIDTSKLK